MSNLGHGLFGVEYECQFTKCTTDVYPWRTLHLKSFFNYVLQFR